MDARNDLQSLNLLDLPAETISNEVCRWLTAQDLLNLGYSSKACQKIIATFAQQELPKIPLKRLFNTERNHFVYLFSLIMMKPAILNPLKDPEALLKLCLQLTPSGLFRLSIIFPFFHTELYEPLETASEAGNHIAFICYALLTTNIETIDLARLSQTIIWLDIPRNKEAFTAINQCLITIDRVRRTLTYVDTGEFPSTPTYINLQGCNQLASAKLRRANLTYTNMRRANLQHTELQHGKLYNTYLRGATSHGIHLWSTTFFDLNDKHATLSNQLDMLDNQLPYDEDSTRIDEAITADLIAQISTLKTPKERIVALETAGTHHFFLSRHANINIQIAFNKALDAQAKPSSATFFGQSSLSSAWRIAGASANTTPKC